MEFLQDTFGRKFPYLRLSITDACNFKCSYCLPHGYQKSGMPDPYLNLSEIRNLVTAFAELGTYKIRITGGEPTVRRDFLKIAGAIREIPGIRQIALSTNGYRLRQLAPDLVKNGITSVNVSVDSLNPKTFAEITGMDELEGVLEGIDASLEAGVSEVKVNSVLLGNYDGAEFLSYLDWIRFKPIHLRFIELMQIGKDAEIFSKNHKSGRLKGLKMEQELMDQGWQLKPRGEADGPAKEYQHSEYLGRMGFIQPYSKDFCATCNRLRVTSYGGLRLCLFGEGGYSLRDLLQGEEQKGLLKKRISELLQKKEVSHYLPEGRYGNNISFSAMGG